MTTLLLQSDRPPPPDEEPLLSELRDAEPGAGVDVETNSVGRVLPLIVT